MAVLAAAIRDLSRDSGVLRDRMRRAALDLACDDVLILADGVLIST